MSRRRADESIMDGSIVDDVNLHLEGIIRSDSSSISLSARIKRDDVRDAMMYFCFPSGHMWRPRLLWAVAQGYDVERDLAMFHGAVLEGIHAATLAEDDRPGQDNGEFRRGKFSCWKHLAERFKSERGYQEEDAMGAGDVVTGYAVHQLTDNAMYAVNNRFDVTGQTVEMLNELWGAKKILIDGQINDLFYTQQFGNLGEFIDFYKAKTGILFALAAVNGARLAGGEDAGNIDDWRNYGVNLGVVYQLSDDLLELRGADVGNKSPENYGDKKNVFDVADVDVVFGERERYLALANDHLDRLGRGKFPRVVELAEFMDEKFRERFNSVS